MAIQLPALLYRALLLLLLLAPALIIREQLIQSLQTLQSLRRTAHEGIHHIITLSSQLMPLGALAMVIRV